MNFLTHLECSVCAKRHEAGIIHNLCECGGPLLVRYDLQRAREEWPRDSIADGSADMWRYAPLLPVKDKRHIVYDSAHDVMVNRTEVVKEVLSWLDQYLGAVAR